MYPHLKIKLNKRLDEWKIPYFLKEPPRAGINFREKILEIHPLLGKVKNEKEIFAYIDKIYEEQGPALISTAKKMQREWTREENRFFKISAKVFNNAPWPIGKYEAYLTISAPMPRFLESKTFQVGYKKNGSWKSTVAHEMLHFIFYEYLRRRYTPQLSNTLEGKMNNLLRDKFRVPPWDLSEIFNVIILNTKSFQKLFPFPQKPYPKHKANFNKLLKEWYKNGENIDKFLRSVENK